MIALCEPIRLRAVSLFFSVRRAKRARHENDTRVTGEARARELPLLDLKIETARSLRANTRRCQWGRHTT